MSPFFELVIECHRYHALSYKELSLVFLVMISAARSTFRTWKLISDQLNNFPQRPRSKWRSQSRGVVSNGQNSM